MPPSCVQRHIERWIIFADYYGDKRCGLIQTVKMQREMRELPRLRRRQHFAGALTHSG